MEPIANYKQYPVQVDEHPHYTGKHDPNRFQEEDEMVPSLKERMLAKSSSSS